MQEISNEELKQKLAQIIQWAGEIQKESFDLCYEENQEISDKGKKINKLSHELGILGVKLSSLIE